MEILKELTRKIYQRLFFRVDANTGAGPVDEAIKELNIMGRTRVRTRRTTISRRQY